MTSLKSVREDGREICAIEEKLFGAMELADADGGNVEYLF